LTVSNSFKSNMESRRFVLTDEEVMNLRQRVTRIHDEGEYTDEEFYDACQIVVDEYSQNFPDDGKIYSLIAVTDFMFMFLENTQAGSPFNKNSLTHFARQLMIESSNHGDWWQAEKVAYRLLTYFALNTTYGEGGEVIFSHFNSWANIIGGIIEGDHIEKDDQNDFMNNVFSKLNNMHDHDVLFYPGLDLWNKLFAKFGAFILPDSTIENTIQYLEHIEETRAQEPLRIADKFRRLKMFFCLLECEAINSRLDDGIFRYSNL